MSLSDTTSYREQTSAIEEVLPGLFHWSAVHEGLGHLAHSSLHLDSRTLIDPVVPAKGLDAIEALGAPRRIVLSNRHHYRHSRRFAKRFSCPVLCHEAGLGYLAETGPVQGFSFDEQLADGLRALELAAICAEESTLALDVADGVLSFGDGLTRAEDGSLRFMPDGLLGDEPEAVKAALRKNLSRMLEEDFDALLFAHAEPVLGGGRALLSGFLGL
jgi:hypothetical protein